jgi:hypothetical protein
MAKHDMALKPDPNELRLSAEAAVESALKRIPGSVTFEPVEPSDEPGTPDFVVTFTVGDQTRNLVCSVVPRQLYPKEAIVTAALLDRWKRKHGLNDGYPVIVASFISAPCAKTLQDEDVGYVDLAGNFRLTPGNAHLEREVAGNPFRVKRELKSLFTPQATRIMLHLLLTGKVWTGSELAAAAQTSGAHVSGLKKSMAERDWIKTNSRSIMVTQPTAVLEAWRQSLRKTDYETCYTVMHGAALEKATQTLFEPTPEGRQILLAGPSAAQNIAPYARGHNLQFIATKAGVALLKDRLQLRPASQGANVMIELVDEADVRFSFAHDLGRPGVFSTDAVSTYLSLWQQGERMREAAEHIRLTVLEPMWAEWPRDIP